MSDTALHIDQPTSLISVVVKSSSGATEAVGGLDRAATTVADLKALLAARPGGVPAEAQRLIYKGRVMKDEMTLEHYGKSLWVPLYSYDSTTNTNMNFAYFRRCHNGTDHPPGKVRHRKGCCCTSGICSCSWYTFLLYYISVSTSNISPILDAII